MTAFVFHQVRDYARIVLLEMTSSSEKGAIVIKEIVKDEQFLSQPAEPATEQDADVAQDLVDTLGSLDDCACLAANQIGSTKAVIAYEGEKGIQVMYNPKVIASMAPYKATEGCLSLDCATEVRRFQLISVKFDALVNGKFVSRTWKLRGWVAEAVQHACDHCAGKLV